MKMTDAEAAHTGNTLDITLLPQPVNPWGWMARQLRDGDYDTRAELERARSLLPWLDWLARATPEVYTLSPVLCMALGQAALDADVRAFLLGALRILETAIQQAHPAPKPGEAPPAPAPPAAP